MREARAARALVLRADVVPHVHRDDRTVLIRVDQHIQAIVESVANEWNVHAGAPAVVGLIVLAIVPNVNRYRRSTVNE
jgi:hypothetical protein